jgi:hypothetical protein
MITMVKEIFISDGPILNTNQIVNGNDSTHLDTDILLFVPNYKKMLVIN